MDRPGRTEQAHSSLRAGLEIGSASGENRRSGGSRSRSVSWRPRERREDRRRRPTPKRKGTRPPVHPGGAGGGPLLDAALVLCADHELNVTTFAARCVASAGATPYAAATAGLAAMGGVRHDGGTGQIETLLREIASGVAILRAQERYRFTVGSRQRVRPSDAGLTSPSSSAETPTPPRRPPASWAGSTPGSPLEGALSISGFVRFPGLTLVDASTRGPPHHDPPRPSPSARLAAAPPAPRPALAPGGPAPP